MHEVDRHGPIKLFKGEKLKFDTNPRFFDSDRDIFDVNVFANEGKWIDRHLGHIATCWTDPERNKNWGHAISALINWGKG